MSIFGTNVDLGPILGVLVTVITALLGWVGTWFKKKADAQSNEANAATAIIKLGEIAATVAGKTWDKLGPVLQQSLADGKIDATERAQIEAIVKTAVEEVTSADTLTTIGKALGLPLPGVIARLAAYVIDIFTKAHDPAITSVSVKAYPVADPAYDPMKVS